MSDSQTGLLRVGHGAATRFVIGRRLLVVAYQPKK